MREIHRRSRQNIAAHHRFQIVRILAHLLPRCVVCAQPCEFRVKTAHAHLPSVGLLSSPASGVVPVPEHDQAACVDVSADVKLRHVFGHRHRHFGGQGDLHRWHGDSRNGHRGSDGTITIAGMVRTGTRRMVGGDPCGAGRDCRNDAAVRCDRDWPVRADARSGAVGQRS